MRKIVYDASAIKVAIAKELAEQGMNVDPNDIELQPISGGMQIPGAEVNAEVKF